MILDVNNNYTGRIWYIFKLWSLMKNCTFHGRTGTVNVHLVQFQFLAQQELLIPHYLVTWQGCARVPGAACNTEGARGGRKDLSSKYQGLLLWLLFGHRGTQRQEAITVEATHLVARPYPSVLGNFAGFKGTPPLPLFTSFTHPLYRRQTLKTRIPWGGKKKPRIYKEN